MQTNPYTRWPPYYNQPVQHPPHPRPAPPPWPHYQRYHPGYAQVGMNISSVPPHPVPPAAEEGRHAKSPSSPTGLSLIAADYDDYPIEPKVDEPRTLPSTIASVEPCTTIVPSKASVIEEASSPKEVIAPATVAGDLSTPAQSNCPANISEPVGLATRIEPTNTAATAASTTSATSTTTTATTTTGPTATMHSDYINDEERRLVAHIFGDEDEDDEDDEAGDSARVGDYLESGSARVANNVSVSNSSQTQTVTGGVAKIGDGDSNRDRRLRTSRDGYTNEQDEEMRAVQGTSAKQLEAGGEGEQDENSVDRIGMEEDMDLEGAGEDGSASGTSLKGSGGTKRVLDAGAIGGMETSVEEELISEVSSESGSPSTSSLLNSLDSDSESNEDDKEEDASDEESDGMDESTRDQSEEVEDSGISGTRSQHAEILGGSDSSTVTSTPRRRLRKRGGGGVEETIELQLEEAEDEGELDHDDSSLLDLSEGSEMGTPRLSETSDAPTFGQIPDENVTENSSTLNGEHISVADSTVHNDVAEDKDGEDDDDEKDEDFNLDDKPKKPKSGGRRGSSLIKELVGLSDNLSPGEHWLPPRTSTRNAAQRDAKARNFEEEKRGARSKGGKTTSTTDGKTRTGKGKEKESETGNRRGKGKEKASGKGKARTRKAEAVTADEGKSRLGLSKEEEEVLMSTGRRRNAQLGMLRMRTILKYEAGNKIESLDSILHGSGTGVADGDGSKEGSTSGTSTTATKKSRGGRKRPLKATEKEDDGKGMASVEKDGVAIDEISEATASAAVPTTRKNPRRGARPSEKSMQEPGDEVELRDYSIEIEGAKKTPAPKRPRRSGATGAKSSSRRRASAAREAAASGGNDQSIASPTVTSAGSSPSGYYPQDSPSSSSSSAQATPVATYESEDPNLASSTVQDAPSVDDAPFEEQAPPSADQPTAVSPTIEEVNASTEAPQPPPPKPLFAVPRRPSRRSSDSAPAPSEPDASSSEISASSSSGQPRSSKRQRAAAAVAAERTAKFYDDDDGEYTAGKSTPRRTKRSRKGQAGADGDEDEGDKEYVPPVLPALNRCCRSVIPLNELPTMFEQVTEALPAEIRHRFDVYEIQDLIIVSAISYLSDPEKYKQIAAAASGTSLPTVSTPAQPMTPYLPGTPYTPYHHAIPSTPHSHGPSTPYLHAPSTPYNPPPTPSTASIYIPPLQVTNVNGEPDPWDILFRYILHKIRTEPRYQTCKNSSDIDVIKRYNDYLNSPEMLNLRRYRSEEVSMESLWTKERVGRFIEAFEKFRKLPSNNKRIAEYVGGGVGPKHVIAFKLLYKRYLKKKGRNAHAVGATKDLGVNLEVELAKEAAAVGRKTKHDMQQAKRKGKSSRPKKSS